jgi:DNA-binding NtrC family response regulator
VGGNETISVNVRLICATQKDLKEEIQKGTFREDLYYRLNVVPITLPPLRERREDIFLLADHFIKKLSKKMGKEIEGLSEEARTLLLRYAFRYPRARERDRAAVTHQRQGDSTEDLPEEVCGQTGTVQTICERIRGSKPLAQAVGLFEKTYIESILEKTKGKKGQTAEILGISRKTLWEKIKELVIEI